MHKSQNMSRKISLPLTVAPVNRKSVNLRPASLREFRTHSPSCRYQYESTEERCGPWDPWDLRDELITSSGEEDESWQGFFVMAGPWDPGYITEADFKEWQQLIREALVRPANEWKSLAGKFDRKKVARLTGPLLIVFDWDGEVPVAKVVPGNSLEGIIATVQVDALQGTQFRVCARPDCKNPPFRIEARHKIFCSPECAHLVAVRNSRKRAQERTERKRK